MHNLTPTTQLLVDSGIRPSYHRLKILEYLQAHLSHPTVDDIFTALSADIPTLSRATVYNTLRTFTEAGLVHELTIDPDAQHYDPILTEHGHFKCKACGEIFNFDLDFTHLHPVGLDGFQVDHKNVCYSGLCPGCQSK